ncbi:predicted esterase of the alpha-beta hydrolase superfamily [Cryptobacterium curtum DSM 15641]|uniref:Predicted esterase of the alpha-beta hydrolase superfamily n=1 Tax=Cryptobacterium curtum (strain ATCC 700683 / DSM 15641 / CCUG 43107 / 12-3) TaxID=469378 RepID=C7MNV4_CRYCD|nr:patatin family protein [Cryptobacterium curtum]ACU94594.1 predicted esterase of the alpha-beta hydrolase superfamily [Cryptobacterium curtum DSM 15641]
MTDTHTIDAVDDATSTPQTKKTPAWVNHGVEPFDLILEGGAMRSLFTAGVTDLFLERGLLAQHTIGTSAGALCGLNYVAGDIGRSAYLNINYCTDWHYLSMRNFALTGNAMGLDFMFDEIPHRLDPFDFEAFNNSPMQLTSVASNLEYGDADYHTFSSGYRPTDEQYLIASASMPFVSHIVEVDGKKLLDGGTCDSVPYLFSMLQGAKKHVIVLTQDATYVKKPFKLGALASTLYANYPLYVERLTMRPFEYNLTYRRLARMHEAGRVFVIQPPQPVTVNSMENNPDKLFDLYQQGYRQALLQWEDLQRYLEL